MADGHLFVAVESHRKALLTGGDGAGEAAVRLVNVAWIVAQLHREDKLYLSASDEDHPNACPHDPESDWDEHFEGDDGVWYCTPRPAGSGCRCGREWPCCEYVDVLAALTGGGATAKASRQSRRPLGRREHGGILQGLTAPENRLPDPERMELMEQIAKRLFNWASILEANTREQAERTATMPFIWPHLALMPDAHLGKGATVGSVIPTLGAIMPAAVGVDIGCGMLAVRTQLTAADVHRRGDLASLREAIETQVPLSAGKYNEQPWSAETKRRITDLEDLDGADSADRVAPNWRLQLGSLGSGNHFIEVSLDELDRVWLFLHSGSRGVGNKLATRHIKIAQEQCERRWISLPDPDLAYLVEGDPEFWGYIRDLRWAQRFAELNREEMMHRVRACVATWAGAPSEAVETIQCHHNYTEQMTGDLLGKWKVPKGHRGHVWLSRKGAIDASEGKPGLIPGSMGTRSYVVSGRGNPLSLNSSPHGAGREYSRAAAKRTFTRDQLDQAMEGIEWRHTDAFLDEIPGAYKDIDVVMGDAGDLVEIRHTLRQVVNVKGD